MDWNRWPLPIRLTTAQYAGRFRLTCKTTYSGIVCYGDLTLQRSPSRGIYPEMAARRARQAAGERSGDGARILNEEVLALLQGVRALELPTLA